MTTSSAVPALDKVVETLRANADRADRDAVLPEENLAVLRDSGLLGLIVPTGAGGPGGSMSDLVAVARTLAGACLSTALVWAMHISQTDALLRHACRDLQTELLPRLTSGHLYLASVTTETGRGSDLFTAGTPLTADDGLLRFTGRRAPVVSGGRHADGFLITLRSAPDAASGSVSLVYADRADLRLSAIGEWDPLGMRGTESGGLLLSGAVPARNVVGVPGEFGTVARESMVPTAHIGWAACWLGAAHAGFATVLRDLRGAGTPPGEAVRERLARIRVDLDLASSYLNRVVDFAEDARRRGLSLATPLAQVRLNSLKLAVSEATARTAEALLRVTGMAGYASRSEVARLHRDLSSAPLNHSNDRMWPATGALALLDPTVRLL
ncbi:acyl-CoA dehydrogenase family protein [Streptomyces sp. NPDC001351]|uniref:acyl-CoA dehydrogenase family protein n=1 Tax=Streptomyces sp. NPDC001351 TaxID=3364564 RepID=UPI0036BCCB47